MTVLERPIAEKDWAREVGTRNGVSVSPAKQPADKPVNDAGAWEPAVSSLSPEWQRLACNLAVIAAETLPRGGRIAVRSIPGGGVEVEASGESILVNRDVVAIAPPHRYGNRRSASAGNIAAKLCSRISWVASCWSCSGATGRSPISASSRFSPRDSPASCAR